MRRPINIGRTRLKRSFKQNGALKPMTLWMRRRVVGTIRVRARIHKGPSPVDEDAGLFFFELSTVLMIFR